MGLFEDAQRDQSSSTQRSGPIEDPQKLADEQRRQLNEFVAAMKKLGVQPEKIEFTRRSASAYDPKLTSYFPRKYLRGWHVVNEWSVGEDAELYATTAFGQPKAEHLAPIPLPAINKRANSAPRDWLKGALTNGIERRMS